MKKTVSFSQLSMYSECQYKWYLNYVKDLSTDTINSHLIFGSAMHHVLQAYLKVMYEATAKQADELDLNGMLHTCMVDEFLKAKSQMGGVDPATKEEMLEFYKDGIEILAFFKKHRGDYFNRKGYSLVGVEIPLSKELNAGVQFRGYIDIVIKDDISGRLKIIDFKTSTNGWKEYAKKDTAKTSQLVLYKKFYADLFGIAIDKIDVEFLILKRKLYENCDFPQKRVQRFSPASGKVSVNQTTALLNEFVNHAFLPSGGYNETATYVKAVNPKKCDWCEHLGKNCPGVKKS